MLAFNINILMYNLYVGLGTPENLAIDSITHNLYFTDAKMKRIGVCNNDGSVCTVLHNKNIDKPRAIAVSPMDGYNKL